MNLSHQKQRILDVLREGRMSSGEIGRRLGIAKSTALGHLRTMAGANIVRVDGVGPLGGWELVDGVASEPEPDVFGAGPAEPAGGDRVALIRELLEIEEELERVEPLVERARLRRSEIMEALR